MKKAILVFLFVCLAWTVTFAQKNMLEGKTYNGKVSTACRITTSGGCLISTYNTLVFTRDRVKIDYTTYTSCQDGDNDENTTNEGYVGTFNYRIEKKGSKFILQIIDHGVLNKLEIQSNKLEEITNDSHKEKLFFEYVNNNSI